jgi:hypothetical protein
MHFILYSVYIQIKDNEMLQGKQGEEMSGTSVIKQVPPKDMRGELRAFIAGANRPSTVSQMEMARKALTLMKTLPASREAIFEYLGTIFDKCVSNYVTHLEVCRFPLNNTPSLFLK